MKSFLLGVRVFLIYLIISLSFTSFLSLDVDAVRKDQQACCEQTKSGSSCVYTDSKECDNNFKSSLTTCENTNFCRLGTCINDRDGVCYSNVGKAVCESDKSTWVAEQSYEIDQCGLGCCKLSNECSYVTQSECKREVSKYPFVNMIFDEAIGSETQCINTCLSGEKGACVKGDKSCVFGPRVECQEGEFYPDLLCSNPTLNTLCAKQQYTSCLGEDVYWFDSCSNPENIYDSDDIKSYNNGYILTEERSCQVSGGGDLTCGNCDYATGTLCGNVESGIQKGNPSDVVCKDLACSSVTENRYATDVDGDKEHGESWCLYDGKVGFGQDLVGSRHFRAACLNGEEVIEPCRDYREEFCVQAVSGSKPTTDLGSMFKIGEGYSEGACKENRYEGCFKVSTQEDCEDVNVRDCWWMPSGIGGGTCVPMVSPGLRFWDTSGGETETVDICEEASQVCEVSFSRGGASRVGLGIGGMGSATAGSSWECVNNCHCLEDSWVIASQNICKAQGDCGAWYNIEGKLTTKGISGVVATGDAPGKTGAWSPKNIPDWSTVSQPSKNSDPNSAGMFFARMAPGLGSIFLGGFVGIYSSGFGVSASAGFLAGVSPFAGTLVGVGGSQIAGKAGSDIALGGLFTKAEATELSKVFTNRFKDMAFDEVEKEAIDVLSKAAGDAATKAAGDAAAKAATKAAAEAAYKDSLIKSMQDEAIKQASEGTSAGSGLTGLFQFINTVAWIYTIYQIADMLFKESKTETYTIDCKPWRAPFGGSDCEKCGGDGMECSEYRCRSLGTSCRLINEGTEQEKCVAQKSLDTNSPIITAGDHKDLNIQETKTKGYLVLTPIEPFTPVKLKLITDEPAHCKFDTKTSVGFDDMSNDFGEGLYLTEHEMLFGLPAELATPEALQITNGGSYNIYVKCEDAVGNSGDRDYFIQFKIKSGPDLTPAKVELTSIDNGAFVPADAKAFPLDVFLNEPADCKWDIKDTDYDLMENVFICAQSGFDYTSIEYGLYKCSSILSGLKRGVNDYYFRCKDQPQAVDENDRNINQASYKYSVVVTTGLQITDVKPEGDVFDVRPELQVTTVQGAENGRAICGYSTQNKDLASMPIFLETNSSTHRQPLVNMQAGPYTFYIACVDKGGNVVKDSVRFNLRRDVSSVSLVERVYRRGLFFVVETSQNAVCQYKDRAFSFGDGLEMDGANTRSHEQLISAVTHVVVCKGIDGGTDTVTLNF